MAPDPRETPVDWTVEAPSRMSVTLGQKADNCPRDAGLYLKYRGQSSSGPLLRGSLVHLFHERMMSQLLEHGESSLFAAQPGEDPAKAQAEVAQTTRQWVDELVEETGWPLSEAEVDEARVMAYHIAIGNEVDPGTIVALEQTFVLELEDGGQLIGKVDVASIVDNILQVDDLKTSYYVPPEEDVARLVQAPWYAAALLWGRPLNYETGELGEPLGIHEWVQWVRCRQVYPRFINPSGFMASRGGDRLLGLADLREKAVAASRAWRRVQRGLNERVWPAKSGAHCSLCTASVECPIPSQLRRHAGTIHTPEQASEAYEWAERQADLVTATKAEVRNYVKANEELRGELPVGSRTYAFHVSHPMALRKKGKNSDWDGLQEAVQAASEEGEPFNVNDWLKQGTKSDFKPKKEDQNG